MSFRQNVIILAVLATDDGQIQKELRFVKNGKMKLSWTEYDVRPLHHPAGFLIITRLRDFLNWSIIYCNVNTPGGHTQLDNTPHPNWSSLHRDLPRTGWPHQAIPRQVRYFQANYKIKNKRSPFTTSNTERQLSRQMFVRN